MHFFLGFIGILLSVGIIRYREAIGDTIGEAEWMRKIGGVYMVTIYFAICLFIYSFLSMFGLQDMLLTPIVRLLTPYGTPDGPVVPVAP
ncbi:TPA: hypothetical protein DCL30_01015 [Candidatus Peribacteria bacterium]|nr:MAG: hypothetical protein A3J91_02905 [Candidatus Peribacteria bacterium RIFOXYC2_FULL_58_10]OGJ85155.1 MAG: hypothetical protein A2529_01680 [Candidatus Peribacteria bacterium RIFOXYD2_FULL_58_15]HAI98108.1 hypothetical protein [Candidatus Peribacteria bacterium]HAS33851.1 hypothetical protein [Candidatus Peribacteria bacterium]